MSPSAARRLRGGRTVAVARACALLLVLLLLPVRSQAASGGPDAFGYRWRDGGEPGVTYSWHRPGAAAQDITVVGDDTTTGLRPLSFAFPYYGQTYSQVAACSNGWLSLIDGTSDTFTNLAIPTAGLPRGVIAAYWNDLELGTRSRVTLDDLGTRAVITWEGAFDRGDSRATATFQVILHADGRIVVQHQALTGNTSSATLGIESPDESTGLQVLHNPVAGFPPAPHVVEFVPPAQAPDRLDCASAIVLACNSTVTADPRATGVALQPSYGCSSDDFSGREIVYRLDLPFARDLRLVLEDAVGTSQVVVLDGCNPNACLAPPGRVVELDNAEGSLIIVVDAPAGAEAPFTLHVDCFAIPARVDCASATALACGSILSGDLARGRANQDRYWCTPDDFSGREQVYELDFPVTSKLRVDLTPLSGAPRMLLLDPCDPNFCLVPYGDTIQIDAALGTYHVVVDAPAGGEGTYQIEATCLGEEFAFCGDGLYLARAGLDDNGSWAVEGLLYDGEDSHSWALDVDGGAITYTQDASCTQFPFRSAGTASPTGPGLVTWEAPEARVDVLTSPTTAGTCCGLLVTVTVTNTDVVPHAYDLRVLHDTAFGAGTSACIVDVVDGGPIEVAGVRRSAESELLPLGADTCVGQVKVYSADDPATLRGSFEMLPPMLPTDMEYVNWESASDPCLAWNDVGTGLTIGGCAGDSALLFLWPLQAPGATLLPGESALIRYRIGWGCEFPCVGPCQDPVFPGAGAASDPDPCVAGISLTWPAATFPGAGNGTYHVYRSEISFADAMLRPPVTPAGGVTGLGWIDASAPTGVPVFHVVQAESLDFAGCGLGPFAGGSTDEISIGPTVDASAASPGFSDASAVETDTCSAGVRLDWLAATFPGGAGGVYHVYRSVLSFADALTQPRLTPPGGTTVLTFTDAAPPANVPVYYVVEAEAFERPGCGPGPARGGTVTRRNVGPLTDGVAADPVLGSGSAVDPDACSRGISLTWDAATFPGGGPGRYHVHRSTASYADALAQPPITGASGITGTSFMDVTVPLDVQHFWALVAEAVAFPGCGDGPAVGGPTASIQLGRATDRGVEDPVLPGATATEVDACAAGIRLDWSAATFPGTAGGSYHVYRSTISAADALTQPALTPAGGILALTYLDAAPPAGMPLHYVVQAESFERPGCGDGPAVGGRTDSVAPAALVDAVSGPVTFGGVTASDADACAVDGVLVTWPAAAFPAPGAGRYHVHRSEISPDDALLAPALTPVLGIVTTAWLDDTALPGVAYHYAVIAEGTDHPGCGDGPSVGGPSAWGGAGPAIDVADLDAPVTEVGPLLRVRRGADPAIELSWVGAPPPPPGETWLILHSNALPSGGFAPLASVALPAFTHPDASPTGPLPHVHFYDVRVGDGCGRLSPD